MKRVTKLLSILLIFALLLPSFAFADNEENLSPWQKKVYEDVTSKFTLPADANIDRDSTYELFKANDEVRIIVELEREPSIVHATKKNLSYKEFSQVREIEKQIELDQKKVKDNILSKKIHMDFIHDFRTTFNGFSGKVKYADIEKIEKLPLVKKVYIANEYQRPEPDLETSKDMVGSIETWEMGYEGEGTVIAIIDSGIDPSHRDMVLSEDTIPKLTKDLVENLIEKEKLLGKYYTEKVPYGYNYYDRNHEIRDIGPGASEHGMHVAGIAGANGDTENGGIKGVAPEAQLLAMKVFSNDPIYSSTYSDIYLKAIDEAVKLGADVLNMSLGSPAGFYLPDSAENIAITNATNNGIVCTLSAGNAGQMTWGWESFDSTYLGYPWKQNPDIGVVSIPGLNKDTIQVASVDNRYTRANSLTYELDGKVHKVPMIIAGNINPTDVFDGPVEFVDGGSGHPTELTNVAGKIALIVRGGLTTSFVDKLSNAQAAGAIGVIVRNHEAGGDELVNMLTPDNLQIPAVFIGYNDGLALMSLEEKFVTFTDEIVAAPNPTGGLMSSFSSWGTTSSLNLKPEITAPGEPIYSTLNNDRYGVMGGTSMAAPHVAGGSALVMEYIKEHKDLKNLPLSEQTRLSKVLLMNTAKILYDEDGFEYSPRRQGAGLMNLYGAVNTPVRVVDAFTKEAKVELKDFEDTSFTMAFNAINHSDSDATYEVDVVVLRDYIYPYRDVELNLLSTDYIYGATINAPDTITVPANGETRFEVTVDLSTDDTIYRNMFVEGFVILIDPNDENPTLSVPYVGFLGDWSEPNIIDGLRFIDPEGSSYFNESGMLYLDNLGVLNYYGTPGRIYMSPGTIYGFIFGTDNVLPYLSFLRNAEFVNFNILDSKGNNLRTIYTSQYYSKDYVYGGRKYPADFIEDAWWFGDVGGEILPDGDYFYEIEAKIHYNDAKAQSKRIPITIDTVVPEVENFNFNPETNKLSFNVIEERSGVLGFLIYIDGNKIDNEPVLLDEEEMLYELDLSEFKGSFEVAVVVIDNAFNMGENSIRVNIDNSHGYIYLLKPVLLERFTRSEVLVEGYVTNFELLDRVLIDGVEAEIEYVEYVDILNPDDLKTVLYSGPAYRFTKEIEYEDGYHVMSVEAISKSGASDSIARMFFVDTTPPELDVKVTKVDTASSTANLRIRMFDNLGYLTLYLGDSQIYKYEEPLVEPNPEEKVIDYTVDLKDGENTFVFTLVDLVNHETTAEITIDHNQIISNVKPDEDIIVKGGEIVDISFNAPTGGEGYYRIMLPFGLNSASGNPMTETEEGLYTATWTVPEGLVASDLKVEVTYLDVEGNSYKAFANGSITVVRDMKFIPQNSVIVGDEAYNINYLNKSLKAQETLNKWLKSGEEVYVKLRDIIVNQNGSIRSLEDLPQILIYYNANGTREYYKK